MPSLRINQFLAQRCHCSRRQADSMVSEGRVLINEQPAKLGDRVSDEDTVMVDGQIVGEIRPPVYLIYNKPVGVICTTDLAAPDNVIARVGHRERVFYVGRLDVESEGLLLLTNDGSIVNQVLKSKYGHEKEYEVTLKHPADEDFFRALVEGVDIGDERPTLPARVRPIDAKHFSIILTEGRNRQVRRMVEALDNEVAALRRVRMMHLTLDDLGSDKWRALTEEERDQLIAAARGESYTPKAKPKAEKQDRPKRERREHAGRRERERGERRGGRRDDRGGRFGQERGRGARFEGGNGRWRDGDRHSSRDSEGRGWGRRHQGGDDRGYRREGGGRGQRDFRHSDDHRGDRHGRRDDRRFSRGGGFDDREQGPSQGGWASRGQRFNDSGEGRPGRFSDRGDARHGSRGDHRGPRNDRGGRGFNNRGQGGPGGRRFDRERGPRFGDREHRDSEERGGGFGGRRGAGERFGRDNRFGGQDRRPGPRHGGGHGGRRERRDFDGERSGRGRSFDGPRSGHRGSSERFDGRRDGGGFRGERRERRRPWDEDRRDNGPQRGGLSQGPRDERGPRPERNFDGPPAPTQRPSSGPDWFDEDGNPQYFNGPPAADAGHEGQAGAGKRRKLIRGKKQS